MEILLCSIATSAVALLRGQNLRDTSRSTMEPRGLRKESKFKEQRPQYETTFFHKDNALSKNLLFEMLGAEALP